MQGKLGKLCLTQIIHSCRPVETHKHASQACWHFLQKFWRIKTKRTHHHIPSHNWSCVFYPRSGQMKGKQIRKFWLNLSVKLFHHFISEYFLLYSFEFRLFCWSIDFQFQQIPEFCISVHYRRIPSWIFQFRLK